MDPPEEGFNELEKAFLGFREGHRPSKGNLKRKSTHSARDVPTTQADIPSDSSTTSHEPYGSSRTTTPPHPPHLSSHHSGMPPTPPTMTNSDIAENRQERRLTPSPLFADRVRNALEQQQQKSGLTTPVIESQSPPTPDPSPPSNNRLGAPRPELPHYASSYAESFKTAREGQSMSGSSTNLLAEEMMPKQYKRVDQHSWLSTNRALALPDTRLAVQEAEVSQPVDSDVEEPRPKSYHIDPDSDAEHSAERNYFASNETSSIEGSPVSPTLRKSLNHTPVKRLWKPLQPGDEIKRPDQALLYGSSGSSKWKPRTRQKTPPVRELGTESLMNALPVLESEKPEEAHSKTPESQNKEATLTALPSSLAEERRDMSSEQAHNNVPEREDKEITLTALPSFPPEQHRVMSPQSRADVANKLEEMSRLQKIPSRSPKLPEVTPANAPAEASRPTTAQKASLEENNKVYKMIQEENAKRHSAISDGSVQAVITPILEHKRKLRHTPKRDSLRADISIVESKRGSEDSAQKLRHKRGMDSLGSVELAEPIEHAKEYTPKLPSARISRFDSGENGYNHRSGIPQVTAKVRSVAPANVLGSPRKLRRSNREDSIGRTPRSVSDSAARPSSMDSNALSEDSSTSPHLRRSSADHRLENNMAVPRTNLTRDTQGTSYPIEFKMEKTGEDFTREGSREFHDTHEEQSHYREMHEGREERTPHRERRASSVKTTATSPRRRSFDIRHLHPTVTPLSTSHSQWSGTEAELCEAKGIELYPHKNESLLLVQSGAFLLSKPAQIDEDLREASNESEPEVAPDAQEATFYAFVDAPPESNDIGNAMHTVDSPLTNPRAAPEPPVIKFIPPTPNHELDRQLGDSSNETAPSEDPNKKMQRRPSLTQRMRRYSESLIQPFPFGRNGSVRRRSSNREYSPPVTEVRPTHLSSFWQPRDFWEEYDSDEGVEEDDYEPLPPGGDTSNVESKKVARFFPRNMSVRMAGLRRPGAFLQGNSLGIERHGTNVRRHYIDKSGPHIVRSTSGSNLNLNTRSSEEMLRKLSERKRRRIFTLPFSGGAKVEYVGLEVLGARMRERRQRQHDRALEKRRDKLRSQIGTRVYHDGGRCGVGGS